MIELIKLNKSECTSLLRKVEPFFVCAKKPKPFLPLHTKIRREVGNKYSLELWCILTGCVQAIKYGNTLFRLPLHSNSYTYIRKYTKQDISYRRMRDLIPLLENLGYITLYKGYYRHEDDHASSFISVEPKLLQALPEGVCRVHGQNRQFDLIEITETVKIRDPETGRKKKIKKKIPTQGKRGVVEERGYVVEYNKLLSMTEISIGGELVSNIVYKRVFYKDLDGAGRWYTIGSFQVEKSYLRETIEIKGRCTTEVDYRQMHPALLHSLKGLKMEDNYKPYKIEEYQDCDQDELRSLCKVSLMCILFSDSKVEAYEAIKGKLADDRKECEPSYKSLHGIVDPRVILNSLIKNNHTISDFFFSGELWSRLQNIDARICTFVINHFTNKDICVLPYHDSFVIDSRYKNELIDVMQAAWENVVGDGGMNFGYDVEFYNKPYNIS